MEMKVLDERLEEEEISLFEYYINNAVGSLKRSLISTW